MITEVAQIATSAPGVGDLQTIAPFAREFGLIAAGFFIMLLFNIILAAYAVVMLGKSLDKISKTLQTFDKAINVINSAVEDFSECSNETQRLLNERSPLLRGLSDSVLILSKQVDSLSNCVNTCQMTLTKMEAKQVDNLPLLLSVISEQQKAIAKSIDSVMQTIIDAVNRSY